MTEQLKAKREALKEISKKVKELMQSGEIEAVTVNAAIVELYKADGHEELHSFKKWLELGQAVRKGEKALLLWGEPKKNHKPEGEQQPKQEGQEPDGYEFYPLAYVFSQKQVEPINKAYHAK